MAGGGNSPTAAQLVNNLAEENLEKIFREYGEEKLSKEIAQAIVAKRKEQPIERTNQLVDVILETYRKKLGIRKTTASWRGPAQGGKIPWVGGLHPATKVFQALRIAVNDELGVIEQVIPQAAEVLAPGGRLAIITFHSLEDRIVKHRFKQLDEKGFRLITKKPIVCSEAEYEANPRARSAKLRIIEKM